MQTHKDIIVRKKLVMVGQAKRDPATQDSRDSAIEEFHHKATKRTKKVGSHPSAEGVQSNAQMALRAEE